MFYISAGHSADDDEVNHRPRPPFVPHPTRPHPHPNPNTNHHTAVTPYKVPLNERAVLQCSVTAGNVGQIVDWRRVDRRPLPPNTFNNNGQLIIENANYDAAGQYECFVIAGDQHVPVGIADLVIVGEWETS